MFITINKGFIKPFILKFVITINLSCLLLPVLAQDYTVWQIDRNPTMYKGITYPINAIVQGCSFKSIILKSSHGKIEKSDNYFSYLPLKVGIDTLTIYIKKENNLIK